MSVAIDSADAGDAAARRPSLPRIPIGYVGVYLIYFSTVVRLLALYEGKVDQATVALLLASYGLLLFVEPMLSRRRPWLPWAYLIAQSAVVVALQLVPPGEEVVATLFVPLSLQAVLLLDRRAGFLWIAAFTLGIVDPVTSGWDDRLTGIAMVALYGGMYFMVGHLAYHMRRADNGRRQNQRLIDDLRLTQQRLRAYAAEVEEFALAQERIRLARELHDSATQTIFSMNLTAQTARVLVDRDRMQAAAQLCRLGELAAGAIAEIGVLVDQHRRNPLPSEPLPIALLRLVAEREMRDGLHVRLEINGEREMPPPVVAGLCGIVQEALNNVAKHSGTREALVRLDLATPARLEIVDNGVGFDPRAVSPTVGHLGLTGMVERARELGWNLSYSSRPGAGARVIAEEGLE